MDNEKKLNLMKFWIFGSIVIIFAGVSVYIGGAWGTGLALFSAWQFWASFVVAAAAGVGVYKYYESYLNK